MIYDLEKRTAEWSYPNEPIEWEAHHAEYGPTTGKSHPDDCPFCKAKGWKTNFQAECDKYHAEKEAAEAQVAE